MTYLATSINESPVITEKASAAITDVRGRAVKYSSGKIVLCGAGNVAVGVGILTNSDTVAADEDVSIQIKDIGLVYTGAAIAKGAELAADANGAIVTAAAGDFIIGIALEAAAAGGVFIRAQIAKLGYKPATPTAIGLNDLTDVDLTVAATNGQVLKYDGTATKWKAGADATE